MLALTVGGSVGFGVRRGLAAVFGQAGSAISVSTVTVSSMLGGFLGVAVGWIMSRETISPDAQNVLYFGLAGLMISVAADAAAVHATITPEDSERLRRRALIHVGIGVLAALLCVAVMQGVLYLVGS